MFLTINVVRLKTLVSEVKMKSTAIRIVKATIFVLFTITLIASLKVIFGGDPSLVTFETVINALLLAVPISIIVGVGIVWYESKNSKTDN